MTLQHDSVSEWLAQLKAGDQQGAEPLWQRYFTRLVRLASSHMSANRAVRDEEDVALSAFDSFCRGAAEGRFPRLDDRDDLWRLLVVIVIRKASDHAQYERRLKRGRGSAPVDVDWGQLISSEPTPAFAAAIAEECDRLLTLLGDVSLRAVAVWKMEGFTSAEIASKMGCVIRTVERKLRVIRELWEEGDAE